MKNLRLIVVTALGLGVSACGTIDIASRNAPLDSLSIDTAPIAASRQSTSDGQAVATPIAAQNYKVTSVVVSVPESLRVSEANLYYPLGDIVWREDPMGDRRAQVKAIVEAGVKGGLTEANRGVPVVLDIEMLRFHTLSQKARYSVGGMHSIKFNMTLRDPATGAVVVPTRKIDASFKGLGGASAVEAESKGITQKVRITEQLAAVIRQELSGTQAPVADKRSASVAAVKTP